MKQILYRLFSVLFMMTATIPFFAQTLTFSQPHGFYDAAFSTEIICDEELPVEVPIRYTLDGSEPTDNSPVYSAPIHINPTFTFYSRFSC